MELEKSMIKRFSFSITAISYLIGMMLLDSIGLYFALNSIKSIYAGIIWYGTAILLLVASISTGFSVTLVYHSSALAYYFRFSKLKMYNYVSSLFLGALISTVIYSIIFTALVTPLISKAALDQFYEVIKLDNVVPFILSVLVSGLFILSLSFTIITFLLMKLGAKATNYASYIFIGLLAISYISPSTSSSLNPFYAAEDIISYSLLHDKISVYIAEVALLAIAFFFLGNLNLRRIKALRLEEVVW